jgi:hypothetical protein
MARDGKKAMKEMIGKNKNNGGEKRCIATKRRNCFNLKTRRFFFSPPTPVPDSFVRSFNFSSRCIYSEVLKTETR